MLSETKSRRSGLSETKSRRSGLNEMKSRISGKRTILLMMVICGFIIATGNATIHYVAQWATA